MSTSELLVMYCHTPAKTMYFNKEVDISRNVCTAIHLHIWVLYDHRVKHFPSVILSNFFISCNFKRQASSFNSAYNFHMLELAQKKSTLSALV